MTSTKKLTEQELIAIAEAKGKKLAFLLASSSLSEKIKENLVFMIEKMTLEQLEELIGILEVGYVNSATSNIDKEFKGKLEKMVEKYKNEDIKYTESIQKLLNDIEK